MVIYRHYKKKELDHKEAVIPPPINPNSPANRVDNSGKQDNENIKKNGDNMVALFAYGSIVSHPQSDIYDGGVELKEDSFKKTEFTLPLSFSRLSSYDTDKERVTLVPNPETGLETPIYYSTFKTSNIADAIKQVKIREGITKNKKAVSYIRKGIPQNSTGDYQTITVNQEVWSYRTNGIREVDAKIIIKFLRENGFKAGLITTFDSNYTNTQIRHRISNKPQVADNTKAYYHDLPAPVKKVHKQALENLGIAGL
jgi:hypothetical protein